MKRHLQVWNPPWWEHCTCAEAKLGNRGQGGARSCAKWAPGRQGVGSLMPSSASSLPGSPFSSIPPPVEPWLQPWREANAKFNSESTRIILKDRWISMKIHKNVLHYSVRQSIMLWLLKHHNTENARSLKHCMISQRLQTNWWQRQRVVTAKQSVLESEGHIQTSDEEGQWSCRGLHVSSSNDPSPSLMSSVQ